MSTQREIARGLAAAILAGALDVDACVERAARLFGRRWRWLRPVAQRICDEFGQSTRPRCERVAAFLLCDPAFLRACTMNDLRLVDRLQVSPTMQPIDAASSWGIPEILTPGALANWLGVKAGELEWLADRRSLGAKKSARRLQNYFYRALPKRRGQVRLIEVPKPRLKSIQRRILAEILNRVPPHTAAHGFRRGRSIQSFAAAHVRQWVVVRMDLENFFPSISAARVAAVFRTLGYPERVADLLAAICANATPGDAWSGVPILAGDLVVQATRRLYARPHLPQGAPTSPALANLCAFQLDCRLAGLAASAGAAYTRYADDLAFSGEAEFARVAQRFCDHVAAIVIDEGYWVQYRKTRIMRRSTRQCLAGVIVNRRLNVVREDYDRLKAVLTNCVWQGASSQNRSEQDDFRGHLLGRIAFVGMLHPVRGQRLRALFDRIDWST